MRYRYGRGVTRKGRKPRLVLALLPVCILAGLAYAGSLWMAPRMSVLGGPSDAIARHITSVKPQPDDYALYIPQLNVRLDIHDDDTEEQGRVAGAWITDTATMNPSTENSIVVGAPKFSLQPTPVATKQASPFYNLQTLKEGDEIFVDHHGTRYAYKVIKTYSLVRTVAAIEQSADEQHLVLYTQEDDPHAPRHIVEAKPIGTVVWDGTPRIEYSNAW